MSSLPFVQMPDDLPKWVSDLEAAYNILVEAMKNMSSVHSRAEALTHGFPCCALFGRIKYEDFNQNINSIVGGIVEKCAQTFAPPGIHLRIAVEEIPNDLIPLIKYKPGGGYIGDASNFVPSKIYQFLFAKYGGGVAVSVANAQAAKTIVDNIGGIAAYYTKDHSCLIPAFHELEDIRLPILPFIERFDAHFKKTKKVVVIKMDCHELRSLNGPGFIDWNSESCHNIKCTIEALQSGCNASEDDISVFAKAVLNKVETFAQQKLVYGTTVSEGPLRAVLRRESLELHLPIQTFDNLVDYIGRNHIPAKV